MFKFVFSADIVKMYRQIWVTLAAAHTEEELIRNQNELIQLMRSAGMELGKWVSMSLIDLPIQPK